MPSIPRPLALAGVLVVAAAAAAGCSSDGGSSDATVTATVTEAVTETTTGTTARTATSGTETKAVTTMSPAELETWQADLKTVGCYGGAIDGNLGPQTEAAVIAFQKDSGLTADGRIGPRTEGALQQAVAARKIVCTTTTTAAGPDPNGSGTASLASPSYAKTFTLSACSLDPDLRNASIRGTAAGQALAVDATEGRGALGVSGGDEQDGVTLKGTVTAAKITTTRAFTITGTYVKPNFAGQTFTLTGTCPE